MRSVLLAFSGGIDSCTAAKKLQSEGYEVVALTLDMTGDEALLKKAVDSAERLGVKHIAHNVQQQFKSKIIDYFANSYMRGSTPAPCTVCNPAIKWYFLLEQADMMGIDYIATGHYFNIEQEGDLYYVATADDVAKDQSYYLWGLPQRVLSRAITPMGHLIKEQIKADFVDKRESMGLCFLGGESYREFMIKHYPASVCRGDIVTKDGRKVGNHDGVAFYTIGQKRGLDVECSGVVVVDIDARANYLIVSDNSDLYKSTLKVCDCNVVSEEELLSSDDIRVVVRGIGRNPQGFARKIEPADDGYIVYLDDAAWAPAVGQPIVFYRGRRVLGGGFLRGSSR